MISSYRKRNTDSPLIRFLPSDGAHAGESAHPRTQAFRAIPYDDLRSWVKECDYRDVTASDLFLAAFVCLLSRLTRHTTIPIETANSGTAVFRSEEESTFHEILLQIHKRSPHPDAQDHKAESGIRYLSLGAAEADTNPGRYGLQLLVREDGALLELSSVNGQWREETLREWLGYLLELLNSACKDPSTPIHRLLLSNESDARKFYASLNRTAVEFPGETSIPGRFALQARQRPDSIAVISANRRYSYRELEELSSQLATLLLDSGAGPGRSVAVCMERSVDLPLALLAVLKSGAYYVPLDPSNPNQRLQSILEECQPVAILSDNTVADSLATRLKLDAIPVLCVDQPQTQIQTQIQTRIKTRIKAPTVNGTFAGNLRALPDRLEPTSLAYTIYTSGTTGKPKGVRITHRALLNLVCSMWRKPGINVADRTLAVAPISFDIATMDMFLPICAGGTLVIASRQDAADPYRLASLLKEHDITCLQATPATWRMLVTSGWSGKRNLKMISGGEALPLELANDLLRRGSELWNCYGPTETTIYSSVVRVERDSSRITVGSPIANTSFYVVDSAGHLLPPGVPGELYIGGLGVSPGYVERPELNAERFVPDRFDSGWDGAHGSLFATGDMVRVVDGGQLEFFGRIDHQVKLRGFRIELGEIESILRTHPFISDAVVLLREDLPGEPRLVAYVLSSGPQVGAIALREHAARSLPEYMLPSVIVLLESFPLSSSGKIDRRALPVPESVPRQIVADRPEAAPARDELEAKLLHIFRDVLRNNSIGVTDSFFLYGGYSLLTVRLFSRIDKELHERLPISILFDAPTVRDLARVIRKGIAPSVVVPIRPYGRSAPIFLVQSYLLYNAILEIVEHDRPVYGLREMGDEQEPMRTEDRARQFAREILSVCPSGPLFLAGWCASGSLTVEIARQLRVAGHEVGLVALFDAERPGFTLPGGLSQRLARSWAKTAFYAKRIEQLQWSEKVTFIRDGLGRNWDRAVEFYVEAKYRATRWVQEKFGITFATSPFHREFADFLALEEVSIRPYPGKLNLFRASDVPNLAEIDATLGWSAIAQEGVEVNFVPGDHVSMFMKPYNKGLAQRLQQDLQNSEARSSRGYSSIR